MNSSRQSEKLRRGMVVIVALAVLTAIEFWVATQLETGLFAILVVIALIKAGLIVEYFMHYSQLFGSEE